MIQQSPGYDNPDPSVCEAAVRKWVSIESERVTQLVACGNRELSSKLEGVHLSVPQLQTTATEQESDFVYNMME